MDKNNPIAKEIERLHEHWQEFIASDKPIFHCKLPPDSHQLVNTWIKLKESFDENNPDLFVHLAIPFSDEKQFAWDLADELNHLVKEGLDDSLPETGEDCQWQAPKGDAMRSGFEMLLASVQAVLKEFGDCLDTVTLAISPVPIKQEASYLTWWQWVATVHKDFDDWPEQLKLLVFDQIRDPFLASVVSAFDSQFFSEVSPVNYTAALNKVLEENDDGSDGANIRKNIFTMQNAIAESDGKRLYDARKIALPIALENKWFDIATTINLTCAAGLMSWQHYDSALKELDNAQHNAREGVKEELAGCDKQLLMGLMNESTCRYLKNDLSTAAQRFEETAEYAKSLEDGWSELEAWRMGSFCYERAGQKREAWTLATRALELGRAMEPDERHQTTLPFVGQAMIRMSPDKHVERDVDQTMKELIGEDWQQDLREVLS